MNLAQSVAVFAYEIGKRPSNPPKRHPDLPPRELVVALETHLRALMEQIDFYGVKRPERICMELQAIAGRAVLTRREASLLLSLIRKTQNRLTPE